MGFQNDDISINTLIGPGSSVKGNLTSAGFIRLDGDLDGKLEATGKVIIGANARIKADIIAQSVIVCGAVMGDIVAPAGVHLFPSSFVLGDIVTQKIQIDDDVFFQGRCIAINDKENFQSAKKRWLDIKAIGGKTITTHSKQK
ncbi:MAG: polymer-forming cytoskeletal protein [Spirochaetaceae bacterium]|nr:polymer-forming cytoskeletal protein [Spirochaetaceae bacterium]MBO7485778.1 polymer-forming cytoskeletal protein [Spirochaetaceae bacterium]MBP5330059.1 polymer-forming cytoskeletal protein [Spirochaetaceae bacterium]